MIEIHIDENVQDSIKIKNELIKNLIKKIFNDNKKFFNSITIVISNDEKLSNFKKKYFNQNVLTDIIAFNLEDPGKNIEGEIYISFERIKENAIKFNQQLHIELSRVFIHGILHLMGYDDKTEKEKNIMTDLENKYIKNIPNILE